MAISSVLLSLLGSPKARAQAVADSTLPNFHLMLNGAGFIPFNSSYRINYESSLIGLPIELSGGIDFPLNHAIASALLVHYRRRTASFVSDMSITSIEVEPGIRAFLEKAHPNDLRLYGTAGLLLVRSTVAGIIDATRDGTAPIRKTTSKDYYNIGLALGLGIEYSISSVSSIYAGLRVGIYLANSTATGGLGNAGGLSLGLGYKYAIF